MNYTTCPYIGGECIKRQCAMWSPNFDHCAIGPLHTDNLHRKIDDLQMALEAIHAELRKVK